MKKVTLLLLLLVIIASHQLKAQYSFSFFTDTFRFLDTTQAVNLTQGYAWPFGNDYYLMPIGFDFITNNDKTFDSVEVRITDGYFGFFQQCYWPNGPNAPSGPELLAFTTGFEDRGWMNNTPLSPVSYLTEGNPGNRIFKTEWRNTGIGGPIDWLDFQVWLHEGSNNIEIRFGASYVSDTINAWVYLNAPLVVWAYDITCPANVNEAIWVYGYRNNPQYVKLDSLNPTPPQMEITGVPDSGMVYRFTPWPLLIEEKHLEKAISIYPNPASGYFYIQGSFALPASLELYDITGRQVYRQQVTSNRQQVDVSKLAGGLYVYRLVSGGMVARGKIILE